MRRPSHDFGRPPTDRFEAADWWLAKRVLGGLSRTDQAAFAAWSADDANRAALEHAEAAWHGVAEFAAEPEILRMRTQALAARPAPVANRRPWAIAAAAALVVCSAGWMVLRNERGVFQPRPAIVAGAAKVYATQVGRRSTVRLDDGSTVVLNTGSAVEVAFDSDRRAIRLLRGQALFEVAKNKDWPFVVTAGDQKVTAVGTAFDVRLDGAKVKVVLVEGKVRVEPVKPEGLARFAPRLAARSMSQGELLVAAAGAAPTVTTADVAQAVAWRQGQVVFRDETLGHAVAEMNRYAQRPIILADARLADLKVSGVFAIERPENFVAAVTTFYPVEAIQRPAGATVLTWTGPN